MRDYGKIIIALLSIACLVFIAYVALGPAKLVPRTGLGWQADHFTGYFGFTTLLCAVWKRAFAVGGGATSLALTLEIFQGLTPDRHPDVMGAFYSITGVLCATLLADFVIRSRSDAVLAFRRRA